MKPPAHLPGGRRRGYVVSKRALDLAISVLALLSLSPLLVAVAVLIRLKLGSPVLFKQTRPGLHAKPFQALKFRTMREVLGPDGVPLPDNERLTPFGRLLRSTSIDELPGLLNVVRGEMSLVGPRPLLMDYLPLYTPTQARRHLVKPGMTGWAQVNGRNLVTWSQRFELDLWYIDNRSFMLDLRILLLTVRNVLLRQGITQEGHATMERFEGTREP